MRIISKELSEIESPKIQRKPTKGFKTLSLKKSKKSSKLNKKHQNFWDNLDSTTEIETNINSKFEIASNFADLSQQADKECV